MNKQVYDTIDETLYTEVLDNGLTVCILPKREMSKTYGIFSTNYGSVDRRFIPLGGDALITVPDGIAHFLEHKLFEKEDRDVFADFGKQGASPNAYTSFTKTAYLFSATNNIEKNVETLIDFVQAPYFSEASVEKEKGIIGQEILMYDDQADWQVYMGTIKALFENHPVNIDIAGTVASIQDITKDDLYTCYNTFYHPSNMTLFICGNVDETEMMTLIKDNQEKKSFESLEKIIREFPEEPASVAMKENNIKMPVSIPKATVGIKEANTALAPEQFLNRDLLQSMVLDYFYAKGGKYHQELYDAALIDSSFFYETSLDRNFGYSMIGGNTKEPAAFAEKVKAQLLATNHLELTEAAFDLMKKKQIGQLLRAMNSLEYTASQYIHYKTFNIDFFQLIPKIEALTVADVNDFMKHWIVEDKLAVCNISAG